MFYPACIYYRLQELKGKGVLVCAEEIIIPMVAGTTVFRIIKVYNRRLDIFQINTLDIAKFMFRYHNNLLPPLFLNLFMTNSRVHRYDTRTAGNYCRHSYRMNIKKFTILYQGPRVWNCLLASITDLSSFATLKNKVLEFLLK